MTILPILMRLMTAKPFRSKHAGPEELLAMDVANFLRAETLEGRLQATWTCIPHEVGYTEGAGRVKAMAKYAKAKAMGFIPGSTDYVFIWNGGGAWVELKAGQTLSPNQKDFKEWCMATGSGHAVCRSVADIQEKLISWGVLRQA